MRAIIIGGTYDHNDGKPSKIVTQLSGMLGWGSINGGSLEFLQATLDQVLPEIDVLLWMPNIANSETKILPTIKKRNPKLLLISSKRADNRDFTVSDMIGRMLRSHSNLGILIDQYNTVNPQEVPSYGFSLLDPLGNIWCETFHLDKLARALADRVGQITRMSRVGSTRMGDRQEFHIDPEFIRIIRDYGERFTKFVNAVNPNRLLGNASTRCAKGFPGIIMDGHRYVTRRNVDKQSLTEEDFVEVETYVNGRVGYYGDNKPSVDTPVQLRLFDYYFGVRYMLHGHVYVEGGRMTEGKTPCGYLNELDEIRKLFPDQTSSNFVVNLRGHGCLIMAASLDYFANQTLKGRPFPES